MKTPALKASLHHLIEQVNNDRMLTLVHDLLKGADEQTKGSHREMLSEDEKQEVMRSFEESEDEVNLVPAEQVLKQNR